MFCSPGMSLSWAVSLNFITKRLSDFSLCVSSGHIPYSGQDVSANAVAPSGADDGCRVERVAGRVGKDPFYIPLRLSSLERQTTRQVPGNLFCPRGRPQFVRLVTAQHRISPQDKGVRTLCMIINTHLHTRPCPKIMQEYEYKT
jgi:hypothetical protein